MKAEPARITMLATRHMSGEISGASGVNDSPFACPSSILRSRDFVEAVLTIFSDKFIMREEKLVDAHALLPHDASLLRPDDNIFYPVLFHQSIRIRIARVDSPNLTLALIVLNPVRADVAGIAHHR